MINSSTPHKRGLVRLGLLCPSLSVVNSARGSQFIESSTTASVNLLAGPDSQSTPTPADLLSTASASGSAASVTIQVDVFHDTLGLEVASIRRNE